MSAGEYYGNSWPFGLCDFPSLLGQRGPLGQLSQIGPLGDLRNKTAGERLGQAYRIQQQADDFWDRMLQQSQGPPSFNCDYWLKRGDSLFSTDQGAVNPFGDSQKWYDRGPGPRVNCDFRPRHEKPATEYLHMLRPKPVVRPSRFHRFASWIRSKWPPAFWLRWKQNRAWKRRQREYDEQLVNAIVSGLTAR